MRAIALLPLFLVPAAGGGVKHIVLLMFENHSFDNSEGPKIAVLYSKQTSTMPSVFSLSFVSHKCSVLGWMKKNNSDINGLTGSEFNPVDPTMNSSQKVYVTGERSYCFILC